MTGNKCASLSSELKRQDVVVCHGTVLEAHAPVCDLGMKENMLV